MLFKQESVQEAADILNESVYLTEEESIMNVNTIPIIENSRIGANVIRFSSLEKFSEDNCLSYIDAIQTIAESHNIDPNTLAVDIPEWKIIEDPELVNEVSNIIVSPISNSNPVYQFVETCIDATMETGDETFMEEVENVLLEISDDTIKSAAEKRAMQISDYMNRAQIIGNDLRNAKNLNDLRNANIGMRHNFSKIGKTLKNSRRLFARAAQIHNDEEDFTNLTKGQTYKNPFTGKEEELKTTRGGMYNQFAKYGKYYKVYDDTKNLSTIKRKLNIMKAKITKKTPVKYIVQAISSLKKKYKQFKDNIENTPPEKRSVIQKICGLIIKLIERFSNFISPDAAKVEEEAFRKASDNIAKNGYGYGW